MLEVSLGMLLKCSFGHKSRLLGEVLESPDIDGPSSNLRSRLTMFCTVIKLRGTISMECIDASMFMPRMRSLSRAPPMYVMLLG